MNYQYTFDELLTMIGDKAIPIIIEHLESEPLDGYGKKYRCTMTKHASNSPMNWYGKNFYCHNCKRCYSLSNYAKDTGKNAYTYLLEIAGITKTNTREQ